MNIALIAHDKKKEMLVNFSIAYENILKKHNYSCSMCNSCEDVNVYHLNRQIIDRCYWFHF